MFFLTSVTSAVSGTGVCTHSHRQVEVLEVQVEVETYYYYGIHDM